MAGNMRLTYKGQPLATGSNQPQSVRLKSGQIFTVPVGEFLMRLGAQSALQFFDSFSGTWRLLDAGPTISPVHVNSDGTNFRVINLSGTIEGVNITNAGTTYSAGTTMSFAGPAAPGVTATGTPIIGGSLTFAVTTGGTGYVNPYLVIPPPQNLGGTPGFCIPASASLTISSGVITTVTVSFAGAGYGVAPSASGTTTTAIQNNITTALQIIDSAGTGAVITPTLAGSGTITGAFMTNPGAGYDGTMIPAVTFTDPLGLGASGAATALPNMALTGVTVSGTNNNYVTTTTIIGTTSLGAATYAPVSVMGEPVFVRPAKWQAPTSGGAIGTVVVEDAGSGFQTIPLADVGGQEIATAGPNATLTCTVGGVNNTLIYWQIG